MESTEIFARVMEVIMFSVAALVGIGLGARVLWRMGSRVQTRAMPAADQGRLERLEHAVESIAIEVERISEGQRFTVNLLSERLPARAGERPASLPPAAPKSTTPH